MRWNQNISECPSYIFQFTADENNKFMHNKSRNDYHSKLHEKQSVNSEAVNGEAFVDTSTA